MRLHTLAATVAALLVGGICVTSEARLEIPSCPGPASEDSNCIKDVAEAKAFVDSLSEEFVSISYMSNLASWAYSTNITDENQEANDAQTLKFQKFAKNVSAQLKRFDWQSFQDHPELLRLAKNYYVKGTDIPEEMLNKKNKFLSKLESTYSTAKVCHFDEKDDPNCEKSLPLNPDLTAILANSRNHEKLKYYWTAWRDQTGNVMKDTFFKYFELSDLAAKSVGFKNRQEQWLESYESEDFPSLVNDAWMKTHQIGNEKISLEMVYKQLHAYMRSKLIKVYNSQGVDIKSDGPIPAHLLGNMWAQSWGNLEDLALPFPEAEPLNVTKSLIEQNFDARRIFEMSESFFVSLGFEPMTETFWDKSMIVKPDDGREVVCHASAWDMMGKDDYRVKMCTVINQEDFITVHHEMGHIAYDMQYRRQPYVYRDAPNPGFHEAIGDTIALAVNTPSHLESVGLLEKASTTSETSDTYHQLEDGSSYKKSELNFLMSVGLEKLAFLPFALTVDTWRWNYFNGKTQPSALNEEWWRLRRSLQGVEAPVARSSEVNMDALAKYHVAADVPYIRYFFAYLAQFQFYEALCQRAGEYNAEDAAGKPLYLCDYSVGGKDTGKLLRDMMAKGGSQHWTLAMNEVTGSPDLSGESIIKYFLPLYKYLKEENAKSDDTVVGWN